MQQKVKILITKTVLLFACLSLVFSCKKGADILDSGTIGINLSAKQTIDFFSKNSLPIPDINDFVIDIVNANNPLDTVFTSIYKNMPLAVNLAVGKYTVTATQGPKNDFSDILPTYKASQEVIINAGNNTAIDITATIFSAVIDLQFSDELTTLCSDYFISIITNNQNYTAAHNQNQIVYLNPQNTTIYFRATTIQGKPISSIIEKIDLKSKTQYTYNIGLDKTTPQATTHKVIIQKSINN